MEGKVGKWELIINDFNCLFGGCFIYNKNKCCNFCWMNSFFYVKYIYGYFEMFGVIVDDKMKFESGCIVNVCRK